MLLRRSPLPEYDDHSESHLAANSAFVASGDWLIASRQPGHDIPQLLEHGLPGNEIDEHEQRGPGAYTIGFAIVTSLGLWSAIILGVMRFFGYR